MKRIILISLTIALLLGTACTAPTQPAAARDLQVASKQFSTITYDLAVKAKYNAMMKALYTIKTSDDAKERERAIIEMSDAYSDVEFLLIQAERAHGLLRNGLQWVEEQRGIVNVLIEDFKKAKTNVEENNNPTLTTTATQPA